MGFKVPERLRVVNGPLGTTQADGLNGAFALPGLRRNTHIFCIASDGGGWEHVSAAVKELVPGTKRIKRGRAPDWEEMCFVKEAFWGDEDRVVQYHPPKSEWVSNHPDVLHLWRPADESMPFPPSIMVGVKGALADNYFGCGGGTAFWELAGGEDQIPTKRNQPEVPIFVYTKGTPLIGACTSPEWVISTLSSSGCGLAFEPGVELAKVAETLRGLAKMLHQAERHPDLKQRCQDLFGFLHERKGRELTPEEHRQVQSMYMDLAIMHPCGAKDCPFCIPDPTQVAP